MHMTDQVDGDPRASVTLALIDNCPQGTIQLQLPAYCGAVWTRPLAPELVIQWRLDDSSHQAHTEGA